MKKLGWTKNLKDKSNPNDNKKTPLVLAKKLIDLTPLSPQDIVLDGFSGKGAFLLQYPSTVDAVECEIDKGIDFFDWTTPVDWVGPTNPPYSKITQILQHSITIARKGIAFLIGMINLTPMRIALLEDAGFGITHMHLCQVVGWFGKSLFIIAQKGHSSTLTYDKTSYRMPPDEDLIFKKNMKAYQADYWKKNNP